MVVSRDSNDDHNYTRPFKNHLIETHKAETPLSPESDKSAPDAAYEFETGGTDDDEFYDDVDHDEIVDSGDSDDYNLADSGFGSVTKNRVDEDKNNRKRKFVDNHEQSANVNNKQRQVSKETKKMKIKMGPKINKSSNDKKNENKKKNSQDSDVDSGKDSPKIVKSRSYRKTLLKNERQKEGRNEYKKTYPKPLIRHRSKGTYSTRSSAITRTSKRLAGKHPSDDNKKSRRFRKTSINGVTVTSTDDEEVKLAAGSLMHLAGFKSSTTVVS